MTLSEDLLGAFDARLGSAASRSEFIEVAVRSYLAKLVRQDHDASYLEKIYRNAVEMNADANHLLDYHAGS